MFGWFRRKKKPTTVKNDRIVPRYPEAAVSNPYVVHSGPRNDDFDATGFAIGIATGVPLSPSHGFSTGALLGAALHSDQRAESPHISSTPSSYTPDPPSSDSGSSWSSDSGSSSDGGSSPSSSD